MFACAVRHKILVEIRISRPLSPVRDGICPVNILSLSGQREEWGLFSTNILSRSGQIAKERGKEVY